MREEGGTLADIARSRYSSAWIKRFETPVQWQYYWAQHRLLFGRLDPQDRVCEVGVGTRFTYFQLKARGYAVESIDIDADKEPDIVGDITELGVEALRYDVVLAFNVFEHVPYEAFLRVVGRCYEAGVSKIFLGLPANLRVLVDLSVRLPRLPELSWFWAVRRRAIAQEHHFWELEYGTYTERRLLDDLAAAGYRLEERLAVKTHRYFALVRG